MSFFGCCNKKKERLLTESESRDLEAPEEAIPPEAAVQVPAEIKSVVGSPVAAANHALVDESPTSTNSYQSASGHNLVATPERYTSSASQHTGGDTLSSPSQVEPIAEDNQDGAARRLSFTG